MCALVNKMAAGASLHFPGVCEEHLVKALNKQLDYRLKISTQLVNYHDRNLELIL